MSDCGARTQSKEGHLVNNALGNCDRGSRKRAQGLLPQGHFVPWIVLPVTNIYIQFLRHVCSSWLSEHGYKTQSGQCALNLDMAFCLDFMLPQIKSI